MKSSANFQFLRETRMRAFPKTTDDNLTFAAYDVVYVEAREARPIWDKYFQSISAWWIEDTRRNDMKVENAAQVKHQNKM